eukprot:c26322_g1_i1 orf=118-279(+)
MQCLYLQCPSTLCNASSYNPCLYAMPPNYNALQLSMAFLNRFFFGSIMAGDIG